MENICKKRRQDFAESMENASVLVLFAGEIVPQRGDQFYPFVPAPNFYYLTHIKQPNLILLLKKDAKGQLSEKLYLERYDEHTAKWDGATLTAEKAKEISAIDSFGNIDEFEAELARIFIMNQIQFVYADMENRSLNKAGSDAIELCAKISAKYPYIGLKNAYPALAKLRLIKSSCEIEKMQKATDTTIQAFYKLLDNVKPGMMEYELEAYVDYTYKANNSKGGFRTIMASGKNATVLHYSENDCQIQDGTLVLTDFGAGCEWYSSDITRTYPANGKFSPRQVEIYNIVLQANKLILDTIKPGVEFIKLNELVKEFYFGQLSKIGLVSSKDDVSNYYYHGVSHHLGLETHDLSFERGADMTLKPGMVLTVEPGLYIADEGIGIRIEDIVVVTEVGCEVLTKAAIKEVAEIEEYMATIRCNRTE